jgi:hypothetical protein
MNQATQPVRGRGTVLTAVAIAVAVVASLAFASMASAAANPVAAGGKTTLTLNSGFTNLLKKDKVKLTGTSPATVSGKTVTLPIEEGKIDTAGAGELTHAGGLKFKAGKKSVTVSGLVLTTSTSSLSAKVGGKAMKFAAVSGLSAARNGFGTNVTIASLKLTSGAAKELNKKLGLNAKPKKKKKGKRASVSKKKAAPLKPLKANQVLGGSVSETQPKTIGITNGSATLNIDLGSAVKLNEVNVKLAPIPPTTLVSALPPVVSFPMGAGGSISPDGKQGSVRTSGGLLLKQEPVAFPGKETKMTLGNIWIELSTGRATVEVIVESTVETAPNEKPANLGNLGRASIGALDMTGATIKSDPANRTVTIENGKASLEETTATVLNSVFGKFEGKEPFKAGDPLGTFSFSATTE